MRLHCLVLLLILGAPIPSRCQESAAPAAKLPLQAESHEQDFRVIVWPEGPDDTAKPNRYSLKIQGQRLGYARLADGSYLISNVPPGHYTLESIAWSGSEYLGAGAATFDVTSVDVVVHLAVGGLGEIHGVATTDKTRTGIPEGVILWIEARDSGGGQGSHIDAAGNFAYGRVLPGGYEFSVLKNPEGIVLRSVQCGGGVVTPRAPLRVGDRQKIAGCAVVLGYEYPASSAAEPVQSAKDLIAEFNSATMSWRQLETAEKIVALHDNSVLPELEPWLSNDDMQARGNAAFIFAGLGDDRGFQSIKEILASTDTKRSVHAIDDAGQPSPYLQIRDDRAHAIVLLGRLKDVRAIPLLVPLSGDSQLDSNILWALGQSGDKSAIPPLVALLKAGHAGTRVTAIQALVQLNAKEALPEIHALLDDNEKITFYDLGPVSEYAKAAIAKLEAPPR